MTMPMGRLAWGQGASYDAVDDRAVITALSNGRVGLIQPVTVTAGAGLQIIIRGGWLGVANCGDLTSAVVGNREDLVVLANPGPASGSRQDQVWLDPDPDEGTWELSVITAAQAVGRPGLPLVDITVPANANLASQMTLGAVDAGLERRLMAQLTQNFTGTWNHTSWGTAQAADWVARPDVLMEPGQWYRVRATFSMLQLVSGNGNGRVGVGWRAAGQGVGAAIAGRVAAVPFIGANRATAGSVEWIFRHAKTDARVWRTFSARVWLAGAGSYYLGVNEQPHLQLTVEDIGS
jgi:hypothetical protein